MAYRVNTTAVRKRAATLPAKPAQPRKGRRPVPEGETSRGRFLRLATLRTSNALHAIRLIGNLANQGYEWKQEDVDHIRNTVAQTLNLSLERFKPLRLSPVKVEHEFRFPQAAN